MMPGSQLTYRQCIKERKRNNQEKKNKYGLDG